MLCVPCIGSCLSVLEAALPWTTSISISSPVALADVLGAINYQFCCIVGVLELAFRLPDNNRLQRRFKSSAMIKSLTGFLTQNGLQMQQHVIMRSFPRKVKLPCSLALFSIDMHDICLQS